MRIKFIYKIIIVPIFYTEILLPKNAAGVSRGFFVIINPKYKNDIGLLEHELTHSRQFWKYGLIVHSLRYYFSKEYRLKCEVEAYKEQLKFPPASENPERYLDKYASYISENYNFEVTKDEARDLLK